MNKLLLPIVSLIILSCSRDSNDSITTDPLIGEWKLVNVVEKNSNGDIIFEENADACDLMDDTVYKSDGTGLITSHSSINDVCFLGATITINNWLNNGNGTYSFSGEVVEEDELADAVVGPFNLTLNIVFSDDMTRHTTIEEENQTDIGNGIVTFETTFERQ